MTTGTIDHTIGTETITLPAGTFVTVHDHAVQLTHEVPVIATTASAESIGRWLKDPMMGHTPTGKTDASGNV